MRYQAADADITTNAMPTNAFEATPPFCRPAAEEFDRISMRRMSGGAASPFRDGRQVQRSDRLQPEEVQRDPEEQRAADHPVERGGLTGCATEAFLPPERLGHGVGRRSGERGDRQEPGTDDPRREDE